MSLTGQAALDALSEFLDDKWSSTTDGAGTTTTLVDSALAQWGDRTYEEAYVRITEDSTPTGNIYLTRRITRFVSDTLTLSHALPQAVASGINYEIHRWDPAQKFAALDRARILAFPQVAKIVVDETVTSDGEAVEIPIPTTIRRGPAQVWYEDRLQPTVKWNILTNPQLATADGWTQTSLTASTYTRTAYDMIVPRHEESCVKLTSGASGSLRQTFSSGQAAAYAGRRMSFGAWVYSRTAGCTVTITDDSATSTSTAHGGSGWQFLTVSRDITGANATTLRVDINPVTNNAVFVENAFFGQVDRIVVPYTNGPIPRLGVHRDDDDANLYLKYAAPRGHQYRLVGRTPVSALGTTASTQVTNTMEVAETDQDLLIATAARVLLTWKGMSTGEMDKQYPQIAASEQRFREMQADWKRAYPRTGFVELG